MIQANPVAQIRQKKQLIQSSQHRKVTRKLSDHQWQWVLNCTLQQVQNNPYYERHLFIISAFYLLGLRISELAETPGRIPKMGDFIPDQSRRWWFHTVSKGNKYRDIAVPDAMLDALRRYRTSLALSPLPLRDEQTPLVPKVRGYGGVGTRQIRKLVQACFNWAIEAFQAAGKADDAIDLTAATVHWLRHTSISHDVQYRPREHVRDDAGHENTSITDLYIETDRIERHESARQKSLCPLNSNETLTGDCVDDND